MNWKNFQQKMQKYFPIYYTSSESCALSKVNWNQRKSIGTHISQLESQKIGKIFLRNLPHDQPPKI